MTYVQPPKPRYWIDDAFEFTITIPGRREWLVVFFMTFWLVGWALGELVVVGFLVFGIIEWAKNGFVIDAGIAIGLFLAAWLGGWTVGGIFAIRQWLWLLRGREIIVIRDEVLRIQRWIPGWSRAQEYAIDDINYMRVSAIPELPWPWSQWGWWNIPGGFGRAAPGQLAFDYGATTVRFGASLEKSEAKMLLDEIAVRYPELVKRTTSKLSGQ